MAGARTVKQAGRDAAPVLAVLALCPLVAALAPDDPAAPLARLRTLISAQDALGLPPETGLVAWLAGHPALDAAARAFHLFVHLPATVGVMVWAWLERRAAFPLIRDTFVAAQALTMAGNALTPVAPRWMLAPGAAPPHGWVYVLQSPYAAMPSGHMVFALIAGGAVFALTRSPALRAAALAYPVLVLFIIAATANHLWLDAIVGAVVAGVAYAGAAARQRWVRRVRRVGAPMLVRQEQG
ncbi:MAG TPA: phosphatase PAP2 family protein [Solirubrobacteraceae bacterium]|jgi:hypothetical protein